MEKYFDQMKQSNTNFQMIETKTENKFGVAVKKYVYKTNIKGIKAQTVSCLFEKGDYTYGFDILIRENRSQVDLDRLDKAFQSFKFLK